MLFHNQIKKRGGIENEEENRKDINGYFSYHPILQYRVG